MMKFHIATARWAATFGLVTMLAPAITVMAGPAEDSPAAAADALHAAITAGDAQGVREFLDPAVLIFESGGVESSLEEYASHHMHADMEFMAGMKRTLLDRQVFEEGTLAVVSTRSRLTGRFRDMELDLFSAETLVLILTDVGWKVRHIHWSSTAAQ